MSTQKESLKILLCSTKAKKTDATGQANFFQVKLHVKCHGFFAFSLSAPSPLPHFPCLAPLLSGSQHLRGAFATSVQYLQYLFQLPQNETRLEDPEESREEL